MNFNKRTLGVIGIALALIAAGSIYFMLAGCKERGPAEKAGEKVDNAVEKAGDATGEALEDAGKAVKDGTK